MPRKDRVLNRWVLGLTCEEIATELEFDRPEAVSVIVQRARRKGDPRAGVRKRVERGPNKLVVRLIFPRKSAVSDDLREEADCRQLSVNELVERLVRHACTDKILGAILDDAT
jgi:hypothetical protein